MVSDNNNQNAVVRHYKTPTFRLLKVGVYFYSKMVLATFNCFIKAVFLNWCSSMSSKIDRKRLIPSRICSPLFNMTHSARDPIDTSEISAREGTPDFTKDSRTWVAQITGICAASQNQRISSWTTDSRR